MTAIIGVMNKRAVAIAADSAVLVTNPDGRKIYNNANKIFNISKYHPIAIMVYNSADFMGIPWETIIKLYRAYLADKCFDSVELYQNDFLNFIHSAVIGQGYVSKSKQIDTVMNYIDNDIYKRVQAEMRKMKGIVKVDEALTKKCIDIISDKIALFLDKNKSILSNPTNIEELKEYSFSQFYEYLHDSLTLLFKKNLPSTDINDSQISLFAKFYYCYLLSDNFRIVKSGLVFVGYGDKDIYPSSFTIEIGEVVNNKVRYLKTKPAIINDLNLGSITPFAQRDIIDTIIRGIHPVLYQAYIESISKVLTSYTNSIKDICKSDREISEKMSKLDIKEWVQSFDSDVNEFIGKKFISPIVNAVSSLSKEDLADMAESLIKLTYLHRRISFNEESVGGPVDVAILSKGDGFVWIRRKHYFDPNLNPQFMTKYK